MSLKITVNGNPVSVTLENEKTVGDVLAAFEKECESRQATIVGICIDGRDIPAEDLDSQSAVQIDQIETISLDTITQDDIKQMFRECGVLFARVSAELENTAVQFQSGRDREASAAICLLADTISAFCRAAGLVALFPDQFGELTIEEKPITEFFSDISLILTEFETALRDKDTVMIGDLAEYEIKPRIDSIIRMIEQVF